MLQSILKYIGKALVMATLEPLFKYVVTYLTNKKIDKDAEKLIKEVKDAENIKDIADKLP